MLVSLDSLNGDTHLRDMRSSAFFLFLAVFLVGCSQEELPSDKLEEALDDPHLELTTGEISRALGMVWCEYTLPGPESEGWAIGPVLEFGGGKRARNGGRVSPISGGSRVKMFAIPEDEKIKVVILSGGTSSTFRFNFPEPEGGTRINNGGRVELDEFLVKGTTDQSGVDTSRTLKENEYGLRMHIQPVE